MAEQSDFTEARVIPLPPSLWPTVYGYAGGNWPPTTTSQARLLVDRATREDLLPLLAEDPAVPAVVKEELRSRQGLVRLYEQRARLVFEEIGRVADAFRGEPFVILKGADYASRLYPQRHHRPFRDIDLFVPAGRMNASASRLIDAGFVQTFIFGLDGEVASHHERTFRRSGISVDLHQGFVQRARHSIDYEAIWNRRVVASIDGEDCFRLADEDAIFYQALSIAIKELHVPIIRYLDLHRLIANTPDALLNAVRNARRWQAVNALVAVLSQARRVVPELDAYRIDEALAEIAPAQRHKRIQHLLPDPAMAASMQRALPRLGQLRRKWMLLDGPSMRVRFAVAYLCDTLSGLLVRLKRHS